MKKAIFLFTILAITISYGQDAVHNYGTIKIHEEGLVGFHMDLINNGQFNQNFGFVGFYNQENALTLSGNSNPVFFDAEIDVENGFYIENTMGIINTMNLTSGIIYTPRISSEINLSMITDSNYFGESDMTMVDGYVSILDKANFTFPVGYNEKLRPVTISSVSSTDYAKGAYFYEDPNSPSFFGASFDTTKVENEDLVISTNEFWHLEGELSSNVTLTWDLDSELFFIGEDINNLKVVGWSLDTNRWENLGASSVTGNLESGSITSNLFVPNDYEIITFGGSSEVIEPLSNTITLDNYYITPNGDGINDRLEIEGIENSPNNSLHIFNRYGILVYTKQNYTNEFEGISNASAVFAKNKGLTSGIYFYVIDFKDIKQKAQGYLYLTTLEN